MNSSLAEVQDKPSQSLNVLQLTRAIDRYNQELESHPIVKLAKEGWLPRPLLQEFTKIQFVDSVLWIPMLSLIKGRIKEPRLLKAVTDNILCESGYNGIPHTTLCAQFAQSVGVSAFYGDSQTYSPLSMHSIEMMNAVMGMSEAEICGWLLAAESLVPTLFQIFKPAFEKFPGADLTYLNEHISVDSDDHAQWMMEGAVAILENSKNQSQALAEILAGIGLGGRVTLCIPDVLYSKALRLGH